MGALQDVKPAFGAVIDTLEMYRLNGIIDYGDRYRHLASTCHSLVAQVRPMHLKSPNPEPVTIIMKCITCPSGLNHSPWPLGDAIIFLL